MKKIILAVLACVVIFPTHVYAGQLDTIEGKLSGYTESIDKYDTSISKINKSLKKAKKGSNRYDNLKAKRKSLREKSDRVQEKHDRLFDEYSKYMQDYCVEHTDLRSFAYVSYNYDEFSYSDLCKIIDNYFKCEAEYLGVSVNYEIRTAEEDDLFKDSGDGLITYGYYLRSTHTVVLNGGGLYDDVFCTISHELRHVWQYEQGYDFSTYKSSNDDYFEYATQFVEQDAESYAEGRVYLLYDYYDNL